MFTVEKATFNLKPVYEKLIDYGFIRLDDQYTFKTDILSDFEMLVIISDDSSRFKVIDKATDEEYTLVHNPDAVGSFVGGVRAECERVITDIINKCFEPNIFKTNQTKLIIEHIKSKYDTSPEFLWEATPNNAIFRDKGSVKWFAALLTVKASKLGLGSDEVIEIINLKATTDEIENIIDKRSYFAAYHMNKKHWYTLVLDGRLDIDEIYSRIGKSFELIVKRK